VTLAGGLVGIAFLRPAGELHRFAQADQTSAIIIE
jgi:hypothetical protein